MVIEVNLLVLNNFDLAPFALSIIDEAPPGRPADLAGSRHLSLDDADVAVNVFDSKRTERCTGLAGCWTRRLESIHGVLLVHNMASDSSERCVGKCLEGLLRARQRKCFRGTVIVANREV